MTEAFLPLIDGEQFDSAVDIPAAVDALQAALRTGRATDNSPLRTTTPLGANHLLYMPAAVDETVGVKLVSVAPDNPSAGLPRIQGLYVLIDETLAPAAVLDAVSLTTCRTAAVSALGVRHLAPADASTLLVFGTGPQAGSHARAICQERPIRTVIIVGRSVAKADALAAELRADGVPARTGDADDVAEADVIACCTSSATPLFDSARLRPHTTVVAMGSHSPKAREVDSALVAAATVVVESREAALAEAGDVVLAIADGVPPEDAINADLAELVADPSLVAADRPRLFKSVGQAWADVVVARLAVERLTPTPARQLTGEPS